MGKDVLSFKLDTGEEIVGSIVKQDPDTQTIVIDRPRAIALMPSRTSGQMGMTLVPFMASNQDGEVALYMSHIVGTTKPHKELEDGYLQSTTNIQLVTK